MDPLTPPEGGGDCGSHTTRPFFHFSLRNGEKFLTEYKPVLQDYISRNIGEILRDSRALVCEKGRAGEREGERKTRGRAIVRL